MIASKEYAILFTTEFTETRRNPLTGDYIVYPKAIAKRLGSNPYACPDVSGVSQMAQTMDHYEKTGEQKSFPVKRNYLTRVCRRTKK